MADHTKSQSQLEKLPPELFEPIAQLLPPHDLFSIRLTSRECAAKVLRTYALTSFTEIDILLNTKRSLRDALELAKHPKFGKKAQILNITVDEWPLAATSDNYITQESFIKTRRRFHFLTDLLSSNSGNLKEIRIKSGKPAFDAESTPKLARLAMRRAAKKDASPLHLILEAIAASTLKQVKLSIGDHDPDSDISLPSTDQVTQIGRLSAKAFRKLTSLTLNMQAPTSDSIPVDDPLILVKLHAALNNAPLLEHLAIGVFDDEGGMFFSDDPLLDFKAPKLKSLELNGFLLGPDDLCPFVQSHVDTLESVRLLDSGFKDLQIADGSSEETDLSELVGLVETALRELVDFEGVFVDEPTATTTWILEDL